MLAVNIKNLKLVFFSTVTITILLLKILKQQKHFSCYSQISTDV